MGTISAVINTCNEADYIEDCLSSVAWADEIVVTDMESTDGTVEKCRQFTDRILPHPRAPVVEPARSFGIENASGDWVLVLDPDERVSGGLRSELRAIALASDSADAYAVPFTTIMFGRTVRHSGWGDEEHVRFFRRGKCTWPAQVHSVPVVNGTLGRIPRSAGGIVHDNYRTIGQFIQKMNRYTDLEAARLHDEGRSFHWLKLFYQPAKEFLNRFIRLKGYKDGLLGLILALMMAAYIQVSYIKLWEIYERDESSGGKGQQPSI